MPRRNRSIKILKKSFLLLVIVSAKLMAAPFEIKVHDELIAELH